MNGWWRLSSCMGSPGLWPLSSIRNSRHDPTAPIRFSAPSWERPCEENVAISGMLKMAPNFVLTTHGMRPSNGCKPAGSSLPAAALAGHFQHPDEDYLEGNYQS